MDLDVPRSLPPPLIRYVSIPRPWPPGQLSTNGPLFGVGLRRFRISPVILWPITRPAGGAAATVNGPNLRPALPLPPTAAIAGPGGPVRIVSVVGGDFGSHRYTDHGGHLVTYVWRRTGQLRVVKIVGAVGPDPFQASINATAAKQQSSIGQTNLPYSAYFTLLGRTVRPESPAQPRYWAAGELGPDGSPNPTGRLAGIA